MKSPEEQIVELKIKLARARNRADYWRRRAMNPFELFKNRIRTGLNRLP